MGRSFRTDVGRARAGVTFAVAVVIGVVAGGWWAAPIALAALVAAAVVGRMARRSFGGLSGDHLGTIEQVTELAGLLIVAGLATRHAPWWS